MGFRVLGLGGPKKERERERMGFPPPGKYGEVNTFQARTFAYKPTEKKRWPISEKKNGKGEERKLFGKAKVVQRGSKKGLIIIWLCSGNSLKAHMPIFLKKTRIYLETRVFASAFWDFFDSRRRGW